jgi:hypothetical protein
MKIKLRWIQITFKSKVFIVIKFKKW